jgi:dynein heavy chain 1, cytosolic
MDADLVIPTVDTDRHQEVLCSWLNEHRPFCLCGPPGSGKTMTLMATLKKIKNMEMIFINFSSGTLPKLILDTLEQWCITEPQYGKIVMKPKQANKWLVIFCDEINLPDTDDYNTQKVI